MRLTAPSASSNRVGERRPGSVAVDDRGAARELFTAGQVQAGQPLESVMVAGQFCWIEDGDIRLDFEPLFAGVRVTEAVLDDAVFLCGPARLSA